MKFSEMQNVSLQDYPALVSTIVWTQGCNQNCWWCSNSSMISKFKMKKYISENDVINYIKNKNKNGLWISALVICGGEPTIHKDLDKFLAKVRKELPYIKIKLDTNGTKYGVLKNLINKDLIDYIAMDVKIHLFKDQNYLKSIELVKDFIKNKSGEFRLTMHPGVIEFEKASNKIKKLFNGSILYLQRFSRKMKLNKDNNLKEYTLKEIKKFKKIIEKKFKKCEMR